LCALFENTKEKFKIYLENALNYWKRKKKRIFIFLPGFGPVQQQPASAPRPAPARGPLLPPAPAPSWAKSRPPAQNRASALLFSVPAADIAGPLVGSAFFLKPPASGVSKTPPIRFHLAILLFPSLGMPPGYKNGVAAPPRSTSTYKS
jgi:hypothetical protein